MKLIFNCKGEKIKWPNHVVIIGLTQVESNTRIKNSGVKSKGARSKPVK